VHGLFYNSTLFFIEYAYSLKLNENFDVYSCGVVVLELIIGQHIVEMESSDMINVVKWVEGRLIQSMGMEGS